jgi:hypothetical protein
MRSRGGRALSVEAAFLVLARKQHDSPLFRSLFSVPPVVGLRTPTVNRTGPGVYTGRGEGEWRVLALAQLAQPKKKEGKS